MARTKTASKFEWLQNRPDLQTPEGQRLLRLLDRHKQNIGEKLDPLLPWLTREWKRGRLHHEVDPVAADDAEMRPEIMRGHVGHLYYRQPLEGYPPDQNVHERRPLDTGVLSHWADWYNSQHPTRQGVDIGSKQFQVPQMVDSIKAWDEDMARQAEQAKLKEQNDAEVLHSWPDGWTVRNLKPHHLDYEGDVMGHCVGGYGYEDAVRNGGTAIVSLRDPENRPHVTAELHPTQMDVPRALAESPFGRAIPESLRSALVAYHDSVAHGLPAPTLEQMQGYTPQEIADAYKAWQTHPGSKPTGSLNNAKIVQIQGKSDSVPIPEYQQRMKDWFQTFPEDKRPNWDEPYNDQIEHIGGIVPTAETYNAGYDGMFVGEPNDDEYGEGGYGRHGDYGLVEPQRSINYPRVIESLIRPRSYNEWRAGGDAQEHDPAEVKALYQEALRRGEIPEFAKAAEEYGNWANDDYNKLEDQNLDYLGAWPGESWEEDPERWSQPDPEGLHGWSHGEDSRTPQERFEEASQYYDDNRAELQSNHAPSQLTSELYSHISPHWWGGNVSDPNSNPADQGYRNELAQQTPPGTFSKVIRAPHSHITTGRPCTCPWGAQRLAKTASKIEWLTNRGDKFSQTPEGQEALTALQRAVRTNPKVDPLTPWLYREIKKNRIEVTPGALYYNQGEGAGGIAQVPLDHLVDWYDSNSPTRRGVDIMQLSMPQMHERIRQWDDELAAKMDQEREMAGTVFHKYPDDWTIRRIDNGEQASDEGDAMGHCVGGYDPRDVGLFSLRDPKNQPHATVEIRHEDTDDQGMPLPSGVVHQIQGKQNSPPNEEYVDKLRDWFQTVPVHAEPNKTEVPIPTDPESLYHWHEPEPDYDYDRYSLSPEEAMAYGIYDDSDPYEYAGPPDWDQVLNQLLHGHYGPYNSPMYGPNDAERVGGIAEEFNWPEGDTNNEFNKYHRALQGQTANINSEFYDNVYDPNEYEGPAEVQWNNWHKGQMLNALAGGRQMLTHDPSGLPLGAPYVPQIHPQQGVLPLTYAKTAAPLYYRWCFSPTSGEVTVAHNGEQDTKLHGDLARERNEPGLVHGYAYRIGGGFRLTDFESKPLTDPFVAAQVMRTLRGEEGYRPAEDVSQDWSESNDDFDRQHHSIPLIAD